MVMEPSTKNGPAFAELQGARILVVDDAEAIRESINSSLAMCGAQCVNASSVAEALGILADQRFNAAIVDVVLPDGSGIQVIEECEKAESSLPVVVITGFGDREMAFTLENAGIGTVITKPFTRAQLRFTLCKEIIRHTEATQAFQLKDDDALPETGTGLIGHSSYIQAIRKKIGMLAQSDVPILIQGPTGTGKEIIAQSIHRTSSRGKNTMIVINSSAIPEHLEESEFFGHAKGAFTGALEEKDGILKCADKATLFLDEVAEFSLRLQAKMLRVLDGHEFCRVGETKPRSSDFRLISATNRPLHEMIRAGTFREDLYYRISAAVVDTKPLSDHREDIPPLARHFIHEFGKLHNKRFSIKQDALQLLVDRSWPGNIRELRNAVTLLCTASLKSRVITKDVVFQTFPCLLQPGAAPVPFSSMKIDFEKGYYERLLGKHGGNISMAAKEAGLLRPNLSKKLRELGITAADYKSPKRQRPDQE
jgi:DNA-binding NtrC family response regulator